MAQYLARENVFISTPIGRDGRGVDLYVYRDGVYKPDGASFSRGEVNRLLAAGARVARINEVVDLLTEYTKLDYQRVNQSAKSLINVRNGMLDWQTGELKPHDPKFRSLIQLNVEYVKDAKSPELDKFLSDVFPNDCIPLVEEFVGYLLIPDTSLQKAFIAIGPGGNGKGTFLKILKTFLGEENVSSVSFHQLEEDRFSISSLFGKLANIYHDLDSRILESASKFKSIVTGDPIGAEQKFKDHYTFEPYCRLLFSANDFPSSKDRTEAYFDRLIFVRFPKKFRGTSDQILDYDKVLVGVPGFLPALLARGLIGLQRLMKSRRFSDSETNVRATEEYRRECSNAYDFVRELCRHDENGWIDRKSLYEKYGGWCLDEGMKPMSAKNFAKSVRDNGGRDGKREGVRGWTGIDWVPTTHKTRTEEVKELGAPSSGGNLDF
jgi:putative DNA primase/helicase